MKKNRNALRAGAFLVVSFAMAAAVAIVVHGGGLFSAPMDVRHVDFALGDDIGGLQVGDDVRVGGFKVGEVKSIQIIGADAASENTAIANAATPHAGAATQVAAPATASSPSRMAAPATAPRAAAPFAGPRLRVSFSFPSKYVLRRDPILRVQSPLTGTPCLNFETLGSGPTLLASADLSGRPSAMNELLASAQQMREPIADILQTVRTRTVPLVNEAVTNLRDTGANANALAADLRAHVPDVVRHYDDVTDHAVAAVDKVGAFFGDTTTDFRATLVNVAKLTDTFNQKLPAILDKASVFVGHIDTTVQTANAALTDVSAAVSNAKDITASARTVMLGNKSKLDGMIASLKEASDNIKYATAEIRHSPWRLLYKPHAGEVDNLNLFDAARQFSDGANELNDAAAALRDAIHAQPADKAQIQKLMAKVEQSFDKFHGVEQDLWTRVKD